MTTTSRRQRNRRRLAAALVCLAAVFCFLAMPLKGRCESAMDPIRNRGRFSAVLYNNKNGLPTSDATAIAQTGDGFLWIGSYAGLIRYDGNTFERIDSTTGIASVRCLYVDSYDRLWIGTNDSGVFLMSKGTFRNWNRSDGLRSVSIRSITEGGDGLMYIGGAAGGIATIDEKGQLTVPEDERIYEHTIPELYTGGDGLVYGRTQEGDLFTLRNGEMVTFLHHDECRVHGIHCIMPDPGNPGRLYIGTEGTKVCYGRLDDNFASLIVRDVSPLTYISSVTFVDGQIWVCASNGAGRLETREFHLLEDVPMTNTIEHVITDYEGNLWFVSSRQGVMKIVQNYFSDLFERYDLPEAVVNSTCMYDGKLLVGTDSGLIILDEEKGKVDRFPVNKAVTASGGKPDVVDLLEYLDGVRIRLMSVDSRGRLWIPTWRKYGLLRLDHGELTVFSTGDGLFTNMIRQVVECEDGSFLVSNNGGVCVMDGDRVTGSYGEKEGIVNGSILTMTEGFHHERIFGSDGDGIYIIGSDGLKRIGTEDGLMSDIILRIKKSRFHDIYWIVTSNSLAYMTPDYQVTTIRQFPYPNNYDLYENSQGVVWVISSAGLYVVPGETLLTNGPVEPEFFGISSGMPYAASANANSELTPDGELFIACSAGVVKVNVDTPILPISDLKVALPYIDADNVRIYPDDSGQFILPAGARKLTFHPHVFNYSMIDPKVSYYLDGFDSSATTVNHSKLTPIDYTNLKLGSYQFVMTVKDMSGLTEKTTSFSIIKGKILSGSNTGTVILDYASLMLLIGILVFTTPYRKRGRIEDRLFFYLILANMALVFGEILSNSLEYLSYSFVRESLILGTTLLYCLLVVFPYLLLVYIDYCMEPDNARARKTKLLYGIPCFLHLLVMVINLKTGWIFSIGSGNEILPGAAELTIIPVWFYLAIQLVKLYRLNRRLCVPFLMLNLIHLLWDLWVHGISSSSLFYTLYLIIMYLYVMNRMQKKEVTCS